MSGMIWFIVDRLSALLEPQDRLAAMGDLIESGDSGVQALSAISGLILRRQFEIWKDWRPWLGLFGISGVAGSFLSVIIFSFGSAVIMQLRTYWKYGVHYGDGRTPDEDIVFLSGLFIAICLWAWSSGFVLRLLSRRAVWLTGTFFCLMVLQSFGDYLVITGHIVRRGPVSFFPPLLGPPGAVILIPVLLGIHQAKRGRLPSASSVTWISAAVFVLSVMLCNMPGPPAPLITGSVCAVASWPLGYMLIAALRKESASSIEY